MTKDDSALSNYRPSLDVDRSVGSEQALSRADPYLDEQRAKLGRQPSYRPKGNRGLTKLRSLNPFKVSQALRASSLLFITPGGALLTGLRVLYRKVVSLVSIQRSLQLRRYLTRGCFC